VIGRYNKREAGSAHGEAPAAQISVHSSSASHDAETYPRPSKPPRPPGSE
jgi:hypothetical protein